MDEDFVTEENEHKRKERRFEGVLQKLPLSPVVAHCATLAYSLPDKLLSLAACGENSMKQDLEMQE